MKSIWVEGDVRLQRSRRSRRILLWTLEVLALGMLGLWLAGMAADFRLGGWIHALLAAAGILMIAWIFCTFKYGEFLEPLLYRWMRGSRLRHSRPQPGTTEAGTDHSPRLP